ncbi:MAG: hypothetical protein JSS96_09150 [Bacteroidetes bacterium]|nr:hypothetical protein [Bacteroidota bacterium]
MKKKLQFIIIVCSIMIIAACTHHSPVAPAAVPVCDTLHVTYKMVIKPMLSAHCYGCHSTAVTQNGGLDLEDFNSLKQYIINDFRGDGIYGSKLYHCMLHAANALPMPPDYKLDSCDLNKMHTWLREGAKNN